MDKTVDNNYIVKSLKKRLKHSLIPLVLFGLFIYLVNFYFEDTSQYRTFIYILYPILITIYYIFISKENLLYEMDKAWEEENDSIWKTAGLIATIYLLLLLLKLLLGSLEPQLKLTEFDLFIENNYLKLFYLLSNLFIIPISEQLFFRRALLDYETQTSAVLSALISCSLNSLFWGFHWVNIIGTFIIALAWTYAYNFNNRNIYVMIDANLVINIIFFLIKFVLN